MKRVLLVLALLCAVVMPAFAADVVLSWDPMPEGQAWIKITAYELVGTDDLAIVGSTASVNGPLTIANVATGTHRYFVKSYDGNAESDASNVVSATIGETPVPITAPAGLTITVIVK